MHNEDWQLYCEMEFFNIPLLMVINIKYDINRKSIISCRFQLNQKCHRNPKLQKLRNIIPSHRILISISYFCHWLRIDMRDTHLCSKFSRIIIFIKYQQNHHPMAINLIRRKEEKILKKQGLTSDDIYMTRVVLNQSRWRQPQQKRYIEFLIDNLTRFEDQDPNCRKNIFVAMSKSIGTRDRNQCKGHHQKMLRKCKSTRAIIELLSHKFKQTWIQGCRPSDGLVKSQSQLMNLDTYYELNDLLPLINPGWLDEERQKLIDFTFQTHDIGTRDRANLFDQLGFSQ